MKNKKLGMLLVAIGILLILVLICNQSTEGFSYSSPSTEASILEKIKQIENKILLATNATCASTYSKNLLVTEANKIITEGMELYSKPTIKSAINLLQTNVNQLILKFNELPRCGTLCENQKDCTCLHVATDLDLRNHCQPEPLPENRLNWKLLSVLSKKPPKRMASMNWIDKNGHLWLYGGMGQDQLPLYDMWKWDGTGWTSITLNEYPPIYTGGMCWVTNDNKLWLFGGTSASSLTSNQIWVWDGKWTLHPPCTNCNIVARTNGAIWTDLNDNIWLFGGQVAKDKYLNDLWKWDGNWTLVNPASSQLYYKVHTRGNQPRPRQGAMTWTDYKNNLWLFGGQAEVGLLNDMWRWDGVGWVWYTGREGGNNKEIHDDQAYDNTPSALAYGINWTNQKRTHLWLYDGTVWVWDVANSTWLWKGTHHPSKRTRSVFGVVQDKVVMFGGVSEQGTINDEMWVLN